MGTLRIKKVPWIQFWKLLDICSLCRKEKKRSLRFTQLASIFLKDNWSVLYPYIHVQKRQHELPSSSQLWCRISALHPHVRISCSYITCGVSDIISWILFLFCQSVSVTGHNGSIDNVVQSARVLSHLFHKCHRKLSAKFQGKRKNVCLRFFILYSDKSPGLS